LMRFRRGELHLINRLDAEQFDHLQREDPAVTRNAGTGLDAEEFWFNQSPAAQGYLRQFLASPPPRRAQMAQQLQAMQGAGQYVGLVEQVAGICNNY